MLVELLQVLLTATLLLLLSVLNEWNEGLVLKTPNG